MESIIIGGISGALAKFIVAPMDRVKTIYQANPNKRFSIKGGLRTVKDIYKKEGFRCYWKGCTASIMRVIPYDGTKFATYPIYKKYTNSNAIAGALAGITGEVIIYPIETLKTRLSYRIDKKTNSYLDVPRYGMYKGLTPAITSTMLYNGVAFSIYKSNITDYKIAKTIISGVIGTTLSYPFDIIKRRRQVGLKANLLNVIKQEGIGALYSGAIINFLKAPIVISISFIANDYISDLIYGKHLYH